MPVTTLSCVRQLRFTPNAKLKRMKVRELGRTAAAQEVAVKILWRESRRSMG
jgi:hypothetical protein